MPRFGMRVPIVKLGALAAGFFVMAGPAFAQDNVAAGLRVWRTAGCPACHGTFGEGGGGGEQPVGPSLRATGLDRSEVVEIVRCGRPDSQMPTFLVGAYIETACWDLPLNPDGASDVVVLGSLTLEKIDLLADYLFARVVGQSDTITRAECAAYFGNPDHPSCEPYE